MTITYQGHGQFTIRSKQATISLGAETKVGERLLPGPGEYDISDVSIEGLEDGIFLLRTEDIFLLYLGRLNRPLTDAELDAVDMADILFIPVGGKETDTSGLEVLGPEAAVKVINQVDPRIVIPMYFTSIEPFRKVEGKPLEIMKDLKVTRSSLPAEERQFVVLT